MRLRNTEVKEVNLSGGIDAWNKEALQGTSNEYIPYKISHPMYRKELEEGFLEDIVNFDYMADGSLIQRNPLARLTLAANKYPNSAGVATRQGLATREGQHDGSEEQALVYLITGAVTPWTCEFYKNSGGVFTTFTTTISGIEFSAVVYNGKWYIYGDRGGGSNAWHVTTGGASLTNFAPGYASGSTGPNRGGALIWKDRCWVSTTTFMDYSKATDPQLWSTANGGGFFQLPNKVDIVDYVIFNDQMYILDKNNNVWVFTYYTDPGVDGSLRRIIKGSDLSIIGSVFGNSGIRKLAVSNNQLFVCSSVNVWQIVNDQLYPIGTQLHLELNGHDEVKLFDLGYGLLLQTYYWQSSTSKSTDYYVYHHNTKAWTRYTFDIGQLADSDRYYIYTAHLVTRTYQQRFVINFGGSNLPNMNYLPFFYLDLGGFFGAAYVDQYMSSTDGTGGVSHRAMELKIKTGPLYVGMKQQYKKFIQFMMDAYLAYRQEGDVPNLTPFKTTVDLVPNAIADKVLSTMQRTSMNDPTEHTYRIPINQRARAVQLTLEVEDREDFGTTFPIVQSGAQTHEVVTKLFIKNLYLLFRRTDSHRTTSDATAHTDNATK